MSTSGAVAGEVADAPGDLLQSTGANSNSSCSLTRASTQADSHFCVGANGLTFEWDTDSMPYFPEWHPPGKKETEEGNEDTGTITCVKCPACGFKYYCKDDAVCCCCEKSLAGVRCREVNLHEDWDAEDDGISSVSDGDLLESDGGWDCWDREFGTLTWDEEMLLATTAMQFMSRPPESHPRTCSLDSMD